MTRREEDELLERLEKLCEEYGIVTDLAASYLEDAVGELLDFEEEL